MRLPRAPLPRQTGGPHGGRRKEIEPFDEGEALEEWEEGRNGKEEGDVQRCG